MSSFFPDLFYNYQDGLTSHDSQRPFSSSSSSSSSTDCEFQHHPINLPLPVVNQQHVPDPTVMDQIADHHLYDSFGNPCGFNNNHHQTNTSPNYHHHHHHHHHHHQHQQDLKPTSTSAVPQLGYTSVIVDTQQYHQMANEFVH